MDEEVTPAQIFALETLIMRLAAALDGLGVGMVEQSEHREGAIPARAG